jgi:hypothetical protein
MVQGVIPDLEGKTYGCLFDFSSSCLTGAENEAGDFDRGACL